MHRRRLVHRQDAKRLHALGTHQAFADNPRALVGRLVTVAPQARHVQQNIRHAAVGYDESIALGNIEPFYHAGELGYGRSRLVYEVSERVRPRFDTAQLALGPHFVRRHDDESFLLTGRSW